MTVSVSPRVGSPRLGFLGTGWIGRQRLAALAAAGAGEIVAIADPAPDCREGALREAPQARAVAGLEELLSSALDGIVIATPSALHAAQARAALEAGIAVFCQKPLGRNAAEVAAVIETARRVDRLLSVDLSYRHTAAAQAVRAHLGTGTIGRVSTVELVFHNAYGPDKPWFFDPELSGGGCVIDLGIHLIDLLLWTLGFPPVDRVRARLWRGGESAGADACEDMCLASLTLADDIVARLACSWFSHEGRDAVVEVTFRGREGALSFYNVAGSFYDFRAELRRGTSRQVLSSPPDEWAGRAAVQWSRRLASGAGFDPGAEELLQVAEVLDRIYRR